MRFSETPISGPWFVLVKFTFNNALPSALITPNWDECFTNEIVGTAHILKTSENMDKRQTRKWKINLGQVQDNSTLTLRLGSK